MELPQGCGRGQWAGAALPWPERTHRRLHLHPGSLCALREGASQAQSSPRGLELSPLPVQASATGRRPSLRSCLSAPGPLSWSSSPCPDGGAGKAPGSHFPWTGLSPCRAHGGPAARSGSPGLCEKAPTVLCQELTLAQDISSSDWYHGPSAFGAEASCPPAPSEHSPLPSAQWATLLR